MNVKKYFLAVVIQQPLFDEIEHVKQQLFIEHGLKGALRSPAHITLHRPFEWKEQKESILVEKLTTFKFQKNITIELNDFSFFEPRVVFVDVKPNTEILQLHDSLKNFAKKELRLLNEAHDMRGFHPHVTVAFRDLKKPLFYELETQFKSKKLTGSFNCNSFCLLKLEKNWEVLETFNFTNE
jgi:2'-5' RNA ligase